MFYHLATPFEQPELPDVRQVVLAHQTWEDVVHFALLEPCCLVFVDIASPAFPAFACRPPYFAWDLVVLTAGSFIDDAALGVATMGAHVGKMLSVASSSIPIGE